MDNNEQQNFMPQNGMPPYTQPQNGMPMNGMPPYPQPQNGVPMNGMPPYPQMQNGMPMNNIPPQWAQPPMPPAPRASTGRTVALVVGTAVGYIVMQLIGSILVGLFAADGSDYMQQFIGVIPFFIFLIIMIVFAMKKKKILTSKGNGFGRGLLAGGLIIYVAVSALLSTFMTVDENGQDSFAVPTNMTFGAEQVWAILAILLSAGICEELMFRGIILNALRDRFGRDTFKGTVWAIVISGILFGCMHFINLLAGVSLEAVLIQVIAVCGMGAFFGAVYCRSGNIWVTIFLHFLMDICVLLPMSMTDGAGLAESIDDTMANPAKLVSLVLYGGVAAFLLRKSVRHELFSYSLEDAPKVEQ